MDRWKLRLVEPYRSAARAAIARGRRVDLSNDVREVVTARCRLNRREPVRPKSPHQPHPLPGRTAARARPHPGPAAPAARSGGARLQEHRQPSTKGRARRRAGHRRQRERQGEVQKKLDIIANEVLIRANDGAATSRPWPARRWTRIYVVPNRYPRANTCCCSTRWTARQHRRQRLHRHHLQRAQSPMATRRGPTATSCSRAPAGRGRLLRLRPADHAGADRGRRRGHVHAGPRAGLVRADRRGKHADPAGHQGIRDQHEQHAPLGPPGAGATSTNAWPARKAPRQGLQHALDGQHGGRYCTAS